MGEQPCSIVPPPCDCCGASAWEYLFTENKIDLGRCRECGLHYIAQMSKREQRMTEMKAGHFADGQVVCGSKLHLHGENRRERQFQSYVDIAHRFAPTGKWLDIGCGTGMLIKLAQKSGVDAAGIELTPDRRAIARQVTETTVYEQPLEFLNLPPDSFAVVTLINVFSHLTNPTETFSHIHRVLSPGGIFLLHTGEIGPNARKHHVFSWELGDHLYFLGDNTIDRYARKLKFQLIHRDQTWFPTTVYNRERFRAKGGSKLRDFGKMAILHTPGAFPLLRWYMLNKRHAGNPIYSANLVLKKD